MQKRGSRKAVATLGYSWSRSHLASTDQSQRILQYGYRKCMYWKRHIDGHFALDKCAVPVLPTTTVEQSDPARDPARGCTIAESRVTIDVVRDERTVHVVAKLHHRAALSTWTRPGPPCCRGSGLWVPRAMQAIEAAWDTQVTPVTLRAVRRYLSSLQLCPVHHVQRSAATHTLPS